MKNKHWLIASKISCIALIPLMVLFTIIPFGYYFSIDHQAFLKEVAEPLIIGKWNNAFMLYSLLVGCFGISIILTTITTLVRNSDDLDNLDEARMKYNQATLRLNHKIKNL
jgi:hypothetical protein